MQQHMPANVYRGRRRQRARRQKWVGLAVLAAAVVVLFVVALLVSLAGSGASPSVVDEEPQAPSTPPPVVSSSSEPVSSLPPEPQREPTEWDEEGIPALFNRFNTIPEDWELDLIPVSGLQMNSRAGEAFLALQAAAAEDGITLVACSGYRSNWEQTNNYNASIQRYLDQGYSQEEATARTERYYAIPGTSEHEAGLAMDVNDANYPGARINDSFADTPAFEWLQENITKFGFIYRYQAETEDITHIAWEPWHYRYVGANHAEKIVELGITLEEYVDMLCRAEGQTPPVSDQDFGAAGGTSGSGSSDGSGDGSGSSGSSDTTAQVPPSMR